MRMSGRNWAKRSLKFSKDKHFNDLSTAHHKPYRSESQKINFRTLGKAIWYLVFLHLGASKRAEF